MIGVVLAGIVLWLSLTGPAGAGALDEAVVAAHHGDYRRAEMLLRPLAESGNDRAQFDLGYMHAHGWGVEQSDAVAATWYRKAADQGLAVAQHYLGMAYAYGDGVPQDAAAAVGWFRRAADQGFPMAQFWLGIASSRGIGTARDPVAAYVWVSLAARLGVASARILSDLARALTPDERTAAQKRIDEWRPRAEAGQSAEARPQELLGLDPHVGEFADPAIWPNSAIGAVKVTLFSVSKSCTGTLVAARLVLTAAHCLHLGGRLVKPGNVLFLAGMNRGSAQMVSEAERLVVANGYAPDDWSGNAPANDWALIVLKQALAVRPVAVKAVPGKDLLSLSRSGAISQVGYGQERPYSPSIMRHCHVGPAPDERVFIFRCQINFGYSGSPILAEIDGAPAVIGVVSQGSQQLLQGIACSASRFEAAVRAEASAASDAR